MSAEAPHTPDPVLVECIDVTRTYRAGSTAFTAVRRVSCHVRASSRIALTGPSGSGKSTLLHILAGLDSATSGTVTWPAFGGPPKANAALVGVVFQGQSLIAALDVTENVALPLVLRGVTADRAGVAAREALARLHLESLADKVPDELSAGQAQRVSIARVLAAAPRLVLADEPTGQLDRVNAILVIEVLRQVCDELGAALVVSTHDPLIARRLDSQWTMHDGCITPDRAGAAEPGNR